MSIVRLGAKAIDTTDPVLGQVLSSTDGVVLGRRNMIINGDMRIAQRGTSATGINSSGYYTVDKVDLAISTTSILIPEGVPPKPIPMIPTAILPSQ